jgi:hypothetical protein
MLFKRFLAGNAILVVLAVIVAMLTASLLSTALVLTTIGNLFSAEIYLGPLVQVLGLVERLGLPLAIVLLGMAAMIRQETVQSSSRTGQPHDRYHPDFAAGGENYGQHGRPRVLQP